MGIWAVSTFWLLWIVMLWICVYMCLSEYLFWVFYSFSVYTRFRIEESYGNTMGNILRNLRTVFQRSCSPISNIWARVLVSPYPCQDLSIFFIIAILVVMKWFLHCGFDSVQSSCSVMSDSLWPHALKHTRLRCPSPTPAACSNSCPLIWWCHQTISSSVIPFSHCLQSFPASSFWVFSQKDFYYFSHYYGFYNQNSQNFS